MEILIIEDERLLADYLAKTLQKLRPDVHIAGILHSVKEGISFFSQNPMPDLVISDIHLGDGLSFEIFATVPARVPVIFCTAYDAYALEAFRSNGIDYLLKPFTASALEKALEKYFAFFKGGPETKQAHLTFEAVMKLFAQREEPKASAILVHHKDQILPIKLEDIALFYLEQEVTHLVTMEGKTYSVVRSLEELGKEAGSGFFRVNRQTLVHRKAVKSASNHFSRRLVLVLSVPFKDTVMVSKERAPQFLQWLASA